MQWKSRQCLSLTTLASALFRRMLQTRPRVYSDGQAHRLIDARPTSCTGVPATSLVAAFIYIAAGCSTQTPIESPGGFQDTVVRISCPDEATAQLVRKQSRAWAARNAARVDFVRHDPKNGPASEADVWLIRPSDLPRLATADKLQVLPTEFRQRESFNWMDLLPHFREHLQSWDRVTYGVPLVGDSPVCFYRSDRFSDSAEQRDYQKRYQRPLGPPTTWEEFADLAEYFTRTLPGQKSEFGLPPLPSGDEALDRLFYTVAACYARRAIPADAVTGPQHVDGIFSFHYNLQTGQPRIDSPGFVHALQLLQRLNKSRPGGAIDEPAETFREGRAVLCLADARWTTEFQKNPALRDRFAICPLPGAGVWFDFATGTRHDSPGGNRIPYLGAAGWMLVVPKAAGQTNAAFDLLLDLAGPVTSRQIVIDPRWGCGLTRRDHLKGAVRWEGFDLDAAGTRALKDALETAILHPRMKNPAFRLRTPDAAERERVLAAALDAALKKGAQADKSLHEAARRWREMDQAKGSAALADYRVSVGLLAK